MCGEQQQAPLGSMEASLIKFSNLRNLDWNKSTLQSASSPWVSNFSQGKTTWEFKKPTFRKLIYFLWKYKKKSIKESALAPSFYQAFKLQLFEDFMK